MRCARQHLDYQQRHTHAYEQLFLTIKALGLGDAAIDQAFRRMVFNVSARNCDDHTKNFAFRLPQGGSWELAPAIERRGQISAVPTATNPAAAVSPKREHLLATAWKLFYRDGYRAVGIPPG